jgi:hypothetical protein
VLLGDGREGELGERFLGARTCTHGGRSGLCCSTRRAPRVVTLILRESSFGSQEICGGATFQWKCPRQKHGRHLRTLSTACPNVHTITSPIMADNVGLTTPRGSGTSGYVQKNRSLLRPRDKVAPYQKDLDHARHRPRQPDAEILEHEAKRDIEVKVFELRDKLEEEG